MATQTLLQIKRSQNTAVPATLANSELAYTANGNILYIGSPDGSSTVTAIGGKRFPGVLTANQGIVTNATSYVDVLKTANLYIGSVSVNAINAVSNSTVLGLASNNELTTTWAIKTYVDAKAASASNPAGSNTYIQFNDSAALGGTAGFTYLKTTNTVTLGNSTVNSTINSTSFSGSAALLGGVSLATINGYITGNAATAFSNAVANAVANATSFATTIAGTAYANAVANAAWYTDGVATATYNSAANTANGYANAAYANAVAYAASNTYVNTNFAPKASPTFSGTVTTADLIVGGNLTVSGTLTTINATNMVVTDSLVKFANGNASNTVDIGFYGQYNDGTDRFTGIVWDASASVYQLFANSTTEPTTIVNTVGVGYTQATLKAYLNTGALISNSTVVNITANSTLSVALVANTLSLSTALPIGSGGTGKSSYGTNVVLAGNGASGIVEISGSAYGVLQLNGSGGIVFGGLDGGTF